MCKVYCSNDEQMVLDLLAKFSPEQQHEIIRSSITEAESDSDRIALKALLLKLGKPQKAEKA